MRRISSSVIVFTSSDVSLFLRLCSWCLLSNAGVLCWIQEQWACCIFLFAWWKMPMQWHEPFTFSRITFLQSASVSLFMSGKIYFLFLSCTWNAHLQERQFSLAIQFTACVKFRFHYFFFLLWKWLHGVSLVAVTCLSGCHFEQCMSKYLWLIYIYMLFCIRILSCKHT